MSVVFRRWLAGCFAFALAPLILKAAILWSYGEPTGLLLILGNADLSLAASILAASSTLDLYLISSRSQEEKSGVFIMAIIATAIGMGYYGATSEAVPGARNANDLQVAIVSSIIYLLAALVSWYTLRIAEEVKNYDRH